MMGKVDSVLKNENTFLFSIRVHFQSGGGHFKKNTFGRKIKLHGDFTSKFGKIKDETGSDNLTEGISFGEQIQLMTFFLDFLNDYRSLNICKMKN